MNKYYPGEQLGNCHKKKGKGKLPIFCGNVERVILIYGGESVRRFLVPAVFREK